MLFLSVRGFLDYAGPINPLALTWLSCCLPPIGTGSASCSIGFSKLNSPAHRYLCLRFKRHLAMPPARLEARMDSLLSFPVGLFHPLQHAGLSRRSPTSRLTSQVDCYRPLLARRSRVIAEESLLLRLGRVISERKLLYLSRTEAPPRDRLCLPPGRGAPSCMMSVGRTL